jgi:hypothetical protein
MFSSKSVLLFGMMCLSSVVDSLIAHTMWNQVLQNRNEFIPARYRVSVACGTEHVTSMY